jgi:hypothetical protein
MATLPTAEQSAQRIIFHFVRDLSYRPGGAILFTTTFLGCPPAGDWILALQPTWESPRSALPIAFALSFFVSLRLPILIRSEEPRSNSCWESSISKEKEFYSRLLTPKQASGNAQTWRFIIPQSALSTPRSANQI